MDWNKNYEIGVELIDKQHQELFERVTRVQLSLTSPAGSNTEIANALRFLVEYTQHHFHDEEALMQEIAYPDFEYHKKKHATMIQKLVEILLDLKKKKHVNTFDFVDFLISWLREHIQIEDQRVGKAFRVFQLVKENAKPSE